MISHIIGIVTRSYDIKKDLEKSRTNNIIQHSNNMLTV